MEELAVLLLLVFNFSINKGKYSSQSDRVFDSSISFNKKAENGKNSLKK